MWILLLGYVWLGKPDKPNQVLHGVSMKQAYKWKVWFHTGERVRLAGFDMYLSRPHATTTKGSGVPAKMVVG
jgi:hypothetical protein